MSETWIKGIVGNNSIGNSSKIIAIFVISVYIHRVGNIFWMQFAPHELVSCHAM
jgi:hypothetical protein